MNNITLLHSEVCRAAINDYFPYGLICILFFLINYLAYKMSENSKKKKEINSVIFKQSRLQRDSVYNDLK